MITKAYQLMTTTLMASLILSMTVVAPVAAQSTSGTDQGSDQAQIQNQDQNQSSNQASPCLTTEQNAGQTTNQAAPATAGQNASQSALIGTGTDNAGAPLDCWLALNAHQSNWYKFRYGYNSDRDDSPNQATVKLAMDTSGCVSFEVWTQDRLTAAQNGVKDDNDKVLGPVGAGSPEYAAIERDSSSDKNQNPAKLIWVGSQAGSETFYVVVKNHRDVTCNYRLSISGFSVSFPSNVTTTSSNNG